MRNLALLTAFLLLTSQQVLPAAESKAVRLRWADAADLMRGKQVSLTTTGGAKYKGRVRAVDANSVSLEDRKNPVLQRSEVSEIHVTDYVGNGRHIGKLAGGTIGLLGGLLGAVAVGMKEGSNQGGDKALAIILGIGGFPLGLLAGYLLGRQADKEITIIHLIPD